jgi:hypothetical protein
MAREISAELKALRSRLGAMEDDELLRFGLAARYLILPENLIASPPSFYPTYLREALNLREARKEWKRRGKKVLREP